MRFHPRLAPIKAAVLPLVNKDGMPEKAQALYRELKQDFNVFYDDKGAVGRRYRRQDEAGTPFCITIDGADAAGRHGDDPRPRQHAAAAHCDWDGGGGVAEDVALKPQAATRVADPRRSP